MARERGKQYDRSSQPVPDRSPRIRLTRPGRHVVRDGSRTLGIGGQGIRQHVPKCLLTDTQILEKVRRALLDFLASDGCLLEVNASERSISHKLAERLQRQFPRLAVDCEYNRYGLDPKFLGQHRVFPDIVVHVRNPKPGREQNVLVIETKKSNNRTPHCHDERRLREFTQRPYHYRVGLFLMLGMGKKQCPVAGVAIFSDGEPAYNAWQEKLKNLRSRGREIPDARLPI